MPLFNAATDQTDVELPPPDRYIALNTGIEAAPDRGFGAGIKWHFSLIDPQSGVTLQSRDGGDFDFWVFTSGKMSPRARARPIVEALLGRKLDVERHEVPDERLLIGRKMICLVVHEPGEDGSMRARVASPSPYVESGSATAAAAAITGAPPGPSAPPPATEEALKAAVKAAIRKAEVLGTKRHLDWVTYEPDQMDQAGLQQLLADVQADILAG